MLSVHSFAERDEIIPSSRSTSLAEVSHAPPSATSIAPVTYEAARLARKRTAWAISVLLPALCSGMLRKAPADSECEPPEKPVILKKKRYIDTRMSLHTHTHTHTRSYPVYGIPLCQRWGLEPLCSPSHHWGPTRPPSALSWHLHTHTYLHLAGAFIQSNLQMRTMGAIKINKRAMIRKCCDKSQLA